MLDEKKIIKIVGETGKELELKADFKAFKNLQKITGNAFQTIDSFASDFDERLELLPVFIKAMSNTDLTLEEIEDNFLGLNWNSTLQIQSIIVSILNFELSNEVKTEEKVENTKSKKKDKVEKN